MQEENLESKGMENMSVEDLFMGIQESYAEAQQRALNENKSFQKTEFFRMDKMGVYRLRILPLAPERDGSIPRKGFEYPVHQMLLKLEKPGDGKNAHMYVTVPRTKEAGYSVDIIDTYRKLAVEAAMEQEEEKLAEKIAGGSFGGGLKYNYGHAMYTLDLSERAKGLQLLTLSHSQYMDLNDRNLKLWQKLQAKNANYPCPVSSVYNAYPVEIEKRKNGNSTEYLTTIDMVSDVEVLTIEEMNTLLAAPRIPEIIYRYSRYLFEATLVFLDQCDKKFDLKVMAMEEMKDAIEILRLEIPKDDKSSFTFDKRTKDSKDNADSNAITLDGLFDRYEELDEQGLGDKTEEGQELRALIRAFIEQENLSIRVTRSTGNKELLDMIEKAKDGSAEGQTTDTPAESNNSTEDSEPAPRERRRR